MMDLIDYPLDRTSPSIDVMAPHFLSLVYLNLLSVLVLVRPIKSIGHYWNVTTLQYLFLRIEIDIL